MGFAIPNCRDRKDDRGREKIKWADPSELEKFNNKWGDMNEWNKNVMSSKTARHELTRNIPCRGVDEAFEIFYKNKIFYKSFAKDRRIGCRAFIFRPADPTALQEPVPPAPATPPKAAATASAPQAATAAVPASASQVSEAASTVDSSSLPRPGPVFKSPPCPHPRPQPPAAEEVPEAAEAPAAAKAPTAATAPETELPVPELRSLPAQQSTASTSSADPLQQHPLALLPKAPVAAAGPVTTASAKAKSPGVPVPAKARPPRAAEPANVLDTTLGRQRVRFTPDVVLARPEQLNRENSLAWLRLHSLERYSVGVEFLHQRRGVSEEVRAGCQDVVRQKRPLFLHGGFGAIVLADIVPAAEPEHVEVFNVRTGFYDPDRDPNRRFHVGYFPDNLVNFCKQSGFKPWLEDALNHIFCQSEASRVQAAGPGPAAEPRAIHCLCWCNKGTHRSVSACRVLTFVAGELRLASCPGRINCFRTFFFFLRFFR